MPAEARFRIRADANELDGARSKLRGFEGEISGFFARQQGSGRRAELAITGALRQFISGDVAGGIELISSRLTGLGLVGGIALGAGNGWSCLRWQGGRRNQENNGRYDGCSSADSGSRCGG